MEFKQFDINLDRFHYIIQETGIRLRKKRIASSSDIFVDFENVGSKIIKENTRKLLWPILSILFFLIGTLVFISRLRGGKIGNGAELFHYSLSLIFLIIFLLTRKNTLYLAKSDNTDAIEFIASRRYKEQTELFIKTLLQARDKYLLETYSELDELLPYEQQYNNLVWLYELKLLTKEQLKKKIEELDKLKAQSDNDKKNSFTKIVGFRRHDQAGENNGD